MKQKQRTTQARTPHVHHRGATTTATEQPRLKVHARGSTNSDITRSNPEDLPSLLANCVAGYARPQQAPFHWFHWFF
jgi:hypothetical protein